MVENNNENTMEKQQGEEGTSIELAMEPVRDNAVFCQHFCHPVNIHLKFLPGKRRLFPIFTL